jgi:hypothetical protein
MSRVDAKRGDKRTWIAINAAQVMTEAAISTRNGMTGDFADFAIATPR